MNYTESVQKYIQTGTIDDLQLMSELAFHITVEMDKHLQAWKTKAHNQELARIAWYKKRKGKKRKDWKEFTDTQADKLGKEEALVAFDYTQDELKYKQLKWLLDRLLEHKITIAIVDKQAKETLTNIR